MKVVSPVNKSRGQIIGKNTDKDLFDKKNFSPRAAREEICELGL
ncbi:MAG: hypothetical protein ACPLRX_09000 [Candidatus Saccharicenans sp.]